MWFTLYFDWAVLLQGFLSCSYGLGKQGEGNIYAQKSDVLILAENLLRGKQKAKVVCSRRRTEPSHSLVQTFLTWALFLACANATYSPCQSSCLFCGQTTQPVLLSGSCVPRDLADQVIFIYSIDSIYSLPTDHNIQNIPKHVSFKIKPGWGRGGGRIRWQYK